MKAKRWAIIMLFALGILKLPLEQRTADSLKRTGTLTPPPDLGTVENLGQMSAAATLGGLRSFVASITFLQSITAFENDDWAGVDNAMTIVTRLQPQVDFYWQTAGYHMAYDAAAFYQRDDSRPSLYRKKLYREHVQRGIDILSEGLKFVPESKYLEEELAQIYERRLDPPDHQLAGNHYMQAFKNGGLPYTERFAAYEWAETNDFLLMNQAYEILRREYRRGKAPNHVAEQLKKIEKKTGMPSFVP